ncbi:MAG: DinB family protein [Anaerolineae bacterium]|nr:DinB family protein [Anaerolineae bacterium]
MTPEAIRLLYDYTYWAFERVWTCIMPLTDAQFTQPIDYSMGSIRHHVVHLMSGTDRWMKRLQGADIPPPLEFEDFPTRAAVRQQWDVIRGEVLVYVRALDQAQLNESVLWEAPSRGFSQHNRRYEILMHVANHMTDHHAQMLAMLHHHFGAATVEQDMVFFLVERARG